MLFNSEASIPKFMTEQQCPIMVSDNKSAPYDRATIQHEDMILIGWTIFGPFLSITLGEIRMVSYDLRWEETEDLVDKL